MNNRDYKQFLPQAVEDLSSASYAGVFIYLALFVTIIYATGYQVQHSVLTTTCVFGMALASLARLLLARGSRRMDPVIWVRWFSLLTLLMVSIWSGFWTYVIYADGLNTTTLLSIAASVGIASAGVGTLAPIRQLSIAVIFIMFWPSGLLLSMQTGGVGTAFTVMFLIGSLFLVFVAMRFNRQYWDTQKNAALLEERAAQLTEATRAKSDFLARMSHEIRTPLNGILGMTQMLQLSKLTPEQRKYAEIIRQSGDSLLTIINDVLDISKIEAGKLELTRDSFDLVAMVNETLNLLEPEATRRGLFLVRNIAGDIPARLIGDAGRLRQILTNLVGNAIKFTETGHIAVKVRAGPPSSQHQDITIQVSDTGIGIPVQDREEIFEAFSQAADTNGDRGGTGLGLAITRELVRLMSGSLSVRSNVGQGSIFTLRLPMALDTESQVTQTRDTSSLADSLIDADILVAEDNQINRLFAKEALTYMGCRVTAVNDGKQAVEAHRNGHFDAILMDIQMPELDGIEATREIRLAEAPGRHTPIIAITANALKGEHERCIDAGLDDYISKPYGVHELQALLQRWLVKEQPANNKQLH